MPIRPANMTKENKNGGLWNNRIKKSVANTLVNTGWSIKPLRIFWNITTPLGVSITIAGVKIMVI
jgi:hypothetical protein